MGPARLLARLASPTTPPLMISIKRIKERKLAQWGLAYLAGGWLGIQVTNVVADRFGWPEWLMRGLILVYAIGFFVTLVLAWYHGEQGAQRVTGMELSILAALLFVGGLGLMAFGSGGEAELAVEEASAVARPNPGAKGSPERSGAPLIPIKKASVAVLPFANLSSDPEQEFFSDGLTEELMDALGRVPGLQVAGRTSSFAFKGKDVPADSVGRALKVAHVLDGSVRKAGLQLRISAQLIDARTGYSVWSRAFDRELADVFVVQGEIGRAIAEALRVHMDGGQSTSVPVVQVRADPEAHLLVLQALQEKRKQTADSYAEAVRLLRRATEQDPEYARAHAELAGVLTSQAWSRFVSADSGYVAARLAARRALALDPREPHALLALAVIAESHDWAFEEAERLYRRALEINPSDAITLANYAYLLVRLGRRTEAVRVAELAAELDPLSAGRAVMLGLVYYFNGEYDRAIVPLRTAAALAPESAPVLANLSLVLAQAGRHADAVAAANRAHGLGPSALTLQAQAYAYAHAGEEARARRAAAALQAMPEVPRYLLAAVRISAGDRDGALDYLERAVDAREDYATALGVDPVFESLRGDPRFAVLIQRIGLAGQGGA